VAHVGHSERVQREHLPPCTNLKYHTLLVATLLGNYRGGDEFVGLLPVVDDAEEIVPHQTVYARNRFALQINENANGQLWGPPWKSPGALVDVGVETPHRASVRCQSRQARHDAQCEPPTYLELEHRVPVHQGSRNPEGKCVTRIQQVHWERDMELPDVESYDDLFLFQHPDHPWLLSTRPRDGLNTHDIRLQSRVPALAHETIMDQSDSARKQQQITRCCVNAYLHADDGRSSPRRGRA
jgi:hypothetical protein